MGDVRKSDPRVVMLDDRRDDIKGSNGGWLFDLGHPLVNRIADSFIKAAAIGAIQAVSREAYLSIAVEGPSQEDAAVVSDLPRAGNKRNRFSELRGEKSLEDMVISAGKESLQWGLAAGVYSGLTYGLKEVRGSHDWKNSAVAGAISGAVVAVVGDDATQRRVVQCAVTGAALSAAAKLLSDML